jgi:hypothetical protein
MSKRMHLLRSIALITCVILLGGSARAQGDGPRAFLLAPKSVWGINAKWLNLEQNIAPGNILVPGADIKVDVFPTTVFHTFSIKGHFAQAYVMVNPGSGTASAKGVPEILPLPTTTLNASGFSDGLVAFKMGLKGAPALNAVEFAKSPMRFSLFADVRVWYSGSYESKKLFNLGTNRLTYHLSAPMASPLNKNRARATWLEVVPTVQFFGANTDPARSSTAQETTQAPLFIIENHLSRNLTPKLWVVANLRFQQGGRTSADGVEDDNNQSILGGGFGGGYQALPFLGLSADYGSIISGDNGATSNMIRVALTFVYISKKKLGTPVESKP